MQLDKMTLGFVGVGVMGEPMCRHLALKSRARVIAADHAVEPLERLKAHGVERGELTDLAREADVIFLSLPSAEAVEAVVLGAGGLAEMGRSGLVLVDLSTSRVETAKRLAEVLNAKGMRFADAPVMRTRAAAEAGTLAIPVGADPTTFADIAPLLQTFASDVMHCGDVGCGQAVKLLNNMVLYETVLALSEACAIGRRSGVDPEKLFAAFSAGSADSFALRNHGMKAILPGDFPLRAFPVSYARKDVQYALDLAADVGIDASGGKNLIACFDEAIAAGHGEKYAPAISLVFERQTSH